MTRYVTLAEYVWLAEQVTGVEAAVLVKASRIDLADSALHAPAAEFGGEEFYPDLLVMFLDLNDAPVGTTRSAARSTPAPLIVQGFERAEGSRGGDS